MEICVRCGKDDEEQICQKCFDEVIREIAIAVAKGQIKMPTLTCTIQKN